MSYHPLLDLVSVILLTIFVIGFTPASSVIRPALVPILAAIVWHCLLQCPESISRTSWAASVGGYTLSSFLHYIDVAVISQWSYEQQGPVRDLVVGTTNPPPVKPSLAAIRKPSPEIFPSRLRFGADVMFSWRFVNTPYQPKSLSLARHDQQETTRVRFLASTASTVVLCYLLLDIMDSTSDPAILAKFYTPDKVGLLSRLADVSVEEVFMRFAGSLGAGIGLIAVQRGVYCVGAFVFVALGIHSPRDWPPFNGPISEVYSLRSFWSVFWHQINTHRLTTMSNFVLVNLLRLPRNHPLMKYARAWMVFLVSAILHIGIDISSGIRARDSGALAFFAIQPLGIVIEDVVRSIAGSPEHTSTQRLTATQRITGLLWIGAWITWTVPAYIYPILNNTTAGTPGVVPFSIIEYFKRNTV